LCKKEVQINGRRIFAWNYNFMKKSYTILYKSSQILFDVNLRSRDAESGTRQFLLTMGGGFLFFLWIFFDEDESQHATIYRE